MPSLCSFLGYFAVVFSLLPRGHAQDSPPPPKGAGEMEWTDLFEVGQGGYKSYRIPCLIGTSGQTALAFTSARKSVSDWADIDIMLRRTTDGGKTWEPARTVVDHGTDVADNPVAIWDAGAKLVHFLYQVNYEHVYYVRSADEGNTFSTPVEITGQLSPFQKSYPWHVIAPGPGHGIQLANWRLVVPVWLSPGEKKQGVKGREHRPSVTSVIYSDDHGVTWHAGDLVPETLKNMNETVAVPMADGGVTLFLRNEDPAYRLAYSYSHDGATGWSKPALQEALYTPLCFASVLRVSGPPAKNRLLFANPDSHTKQQAIREWGARPRENLTFKLSYDEGKSWPMQKVLDPGRSGYSDLAVLEDGTLLCVFERGFVAGNDLNTRYLTAARFDLKWLTDGKDTLK